MIIIYSVCPIFTNPPDWRKALSNGVKTHLFKLKTSKISRRGLKLWGKNDSSERGGGMIQMHNIYPCSDIKAFNRTIINYNIHPSIRMETGCRLYISSSAPKIIATYLKISVIIIHILWYVHFFPEIALKFSKMILRT